MTPPATRQIFEIVDPQHMRETAPGVRAASVSAAILSHPRG